MPLVRQHGRRQSPEKLPRQNQQRAWGGGFAIQQKFLSKESRPRPTRGHCTLSACSLPASGSRVPARQWWRHHATNPDAGAVPGGLLLVARRRGRRATCGPRLAPLPGAFLPGKRRPRTGGRVLRPALVSSVPSRIYHPYTVGPVFSSFHPDRGSDRHTKAIKS